MHFPFREWLCNVSEWHSTTKLLKYLISRNLKYPFTVRDTAGQENCRLISTVNRAAFLNVLSTSKCRRLKTAFYLRQSCICVLIGGFTSCTVALKLYMICHCLAVIRPTFDAQNCSSVKTQFFCWMSCAAALLPLLFLIASLVSPYSVHEFRERCAAFPEDCIRYCTAPFAINCLFQYRRTLVQRSE
jgi:hypothetical protein